MNDVTEIEIGVYNAEVGAVPIKVTENWVVAVMPMAFNDRVILCRHWEWTEVRGYVAGWCYDKGGAAALAAMAWDPETERTPVGWKKQACDGRPK